MRLRSLIILCICLITALMVSGFLYVNLKKNITSTPPVFSKRNMLEALWFHYKKDYLEPGTLRALDKQRDNITTSEGQSYTMLRAVWIDDKQTFDTTLQWTKDNMQRDEDHLFHWLFGERDDGTYGILIDQGGENTATDADVDIALSLLFASKRWNTNAYFGDAIEIIRDIWDNEVVVINGKPYILANNIEKTIGNKDTYVINPSYYAPYAYKIFAEIDGEHDWEGLVDTSYEVLNENINSSLDTGSSAAIPSDWLNINKETGSIEVIKNAPTLTTNYSYDALRTPWRLALDAQWFDESRAKRVLGKMSFFQNEWGKNAALYTNYRHNGSVVESKETAAMYGGSIGYFMLARPSLSGEVYAQKLEKLYNSDTYTWREPLGYYDSNWAWFGIALYNDLLPQLYPTPHRAQTP